MEKQNYNAIDLTKFIAALFIVAIHAPPFLSINSDLDFFMIEGIARMAVPFYFIAAGFFLAGKIHDYGSVKKYVLRMLRLYVIWTVLYLPFIISKASLELDRTFAFQIVVFIRDFLFVGSYGQLWYLPSLAVAVLGLHFLMRYLSEKKVFVLAIAAFAVGLLGESYLGLLKNIPAIDGLFSIYLRLFGTTRNALFFAPVFLMTGIRIKNGKMPISRKNAAIGLFVSVVALLCEVAMLRHFELANDYNLLISLLPASIFLFSFLKQTALQNTPVFHYLRQCSILIYVLHVMVICIYSALVVSVPPLNHSFISYVAIVSITLALSMLALYLEKKYACFRWIKFLH